MRNLRIWIICAVALGGIALGTWGGFPVFDDASLLLLWVEKGPGTLLSSNLHRPIVGLLLQSFVDLFGITKPPYVLINLVFWGIFSLETFFLSRRLFPERTTAALSALFVLAPFLVKTHYTTINTLFPCNLPVLISVGVLLLCLKENIRTPFLLLASIITVIASAMSEYAVAASVASITILIVLKKNRAALAVLIGALIGYVIFQTTADFSYRPSRAMGTQIEMLSSRPLSAITHFIHAVWTSLLGAYGGAAGKFAFDSDSRSTVVAATIGIAAAVLMLQFTRRNSEEIANKKREMIALILAVLGGLLPVVIANQNPSGGDSYETRFFIPILPFATIVTVRSILYLTKQELRPIVSAVLAFIAIATVFNGAFEVRREQKSLESFSRLLRPIVERDSGMTIVVVPDYEKLDGSDITPKIVLDWPRELLQKVWIVPAWQMLTLNGPRTNCTSMYFNLSRGVLATGRKGQISNLFFVPEFWTAQGRFSLNSFEPYCINKITTSKTPD